MCLFNVKARLPFCSEHENCQVHKIQRPNNKSKLCALFYLLFCFQCYVSTFLLTLEKLKNLDQYFNCRASFEFPKMLRRFLRGLCNISKAYCKVVRKVLLNFAYNKNTLLEYRDEVLGGTFQQEISQIIEFL